MRLMIKSASRNPWDLGRAYYSGISFSVTAKDTAPMGITFKNDGTKMYIVGNDSDSVHEYNLSTAWDISTSSFLQSFDVSTQDTGPADITFKTDGTKVFIVGLQNDSVYEYALSTAWGISSASFTQSFDVSPQGDDHTGFAFKSDGTKMFTMESTSSVSKVVEYALSTAWGISSASFTQTFTTGGQDTNPTSVNFSSSGKKMFVLGGASKKIYEYFLSTAWDISTSVLGRSFSVAISGAGPLGSVFNSDGTKIYVAQNNGTIYQYVI